MINIILFPLNQLIQFKLCRLLICLPCLPFIILDAIHIHGKVTFLLVKVGQKNRISTHRHIHDTIKKSLYALYTPICIAVYTLSSGEISLTSSPLTAIIKLTMFDGLCIIVTVQDKGSRLSLSEITHLFKGTNPALIRISAILTETWFYTILIS